MKSSKDFDTDQEYRSYLRTYFAAKAMEAFIAARVYEEWSKPEYHRSRKHIYSVRRRPHRSP